VRTSKSGPWVRSAITKILQSKWDFKELYAYYLISATSIIDNISTMATIVAKPVTETQCRPFAGLLLISSSQPGRRPLKQQRQGHGGGDRLQTQVLASSGDIKPATNIRLGDRPD
jgi:hypothetical protein